MMAAKKATSKKTTVADKPSGKDKSKVNTTVDPLADLGLDDQPARVTAQTVEQAATAQAAPTASEPSTNEGAEREEVEVGEIEFGFDSFIPVAKRKADGSKYKFDQLPAPGVFEDGPNKGKPKIANFKVKLQPGVDADKLRRSVQSATTQANRQGSEAGKYFVSRSLTEGDKFVGMVVYRTDAKPEK